MPRIDTITKNGFFKKLVYKCDDIKQEYFNDPIWYVYANLKHFFGTKKEIRWPTDNFTQPLATAFICWMVEGSEDKIAAAQEDIMASVEKAAANLKKDKKYYTKLKIW